VSFEVAAAAYDRFMGRFAVPLAALFAARVGAGAGQTALDVGCGPGALTEQLVARLGAAAVTAIDPSESFVSAVRERLPEVDVRRGVVEALPFADGSFDLTLAQLVVHFMSDPLRAWRKWPGSRAPVDSSRHACGMKLPAATGLWLLSGKPRATSIRKYRTNPSAPARMKASSSSCSSLRG
jgi:SAM-dependent methyltransferase